MFDHIYARWRRTGTVVLLTGVLAFASAAAPAAAGPQSPAKPTPAAKPTTVLFMCPHGAAMSVLASAYFQRLAKERGLNVRVDAVGIEPDPTVSPKVAAHLKKQGYDVPIAKPRLVGSEDLTAADIVISLRCDLTGVPAPRGALKKWDDVPFPSQDFAGSDEAIRQHVIDLIEELVQQRK